MPRIKKEKTEAEKFIAAAERKRKATPMPPPKDDPIAELRQLTLEHHALYRTMQSFDSVCRDRTIRKGDRKGQIIPSPLPMVMREEIQQLCHGDKAKKRSGYIDDGKARFTLSMEGEMKKKEALMARALKSVPIYNQFLKHVYGLGPVVSAYLVSEIDIHDSTDDRGNVIRARKPSAIIKYAGFAIDHKINRLDRRTKGQKNGYNSELRKRMYQFLTASFKNASPKKHGGHVSSKYLDVWANKKIGVLSRQAPPGGREPTKGSAFSAGWHTAGRVFLNDLYTVWRAIEGLPVWPDYYAAKLGYGHGGKIVVNAPTMLSVDEALALVGDVGKYRIEHPLALFNSTGDADGDMTELVDGAEMDDVDGVEDALMEDAAE